MSLLEKQIRLVMPKGTECKPGGGDTGSALQHDEAEEEDEQLFTFEEMRAELERLKADLESADTSSSKLNSKAKLLLDPTAPCGLPAGVPELPVGLRISSEMKQLGAALLMAAEGVRIGFREPRARPCAVSRSCHSCVVRCCFC